MGADNVNRPLARDCWMIQERTAYIFKRPSKECCDRRGRTQQEFCAVLIKYLQILRNLLKPPP
ncbi:hypothetical protein BGS_0009 [Beggiatoa sp. SS]|nr:hypothetical protein BGS_0009 [Beggiatoa sp. SS]